MAPDFAFDLISSFLGMALLVATLAVPTFLVWAIARRSFRKFGFKNISLGYFSVAVSMLILSIGIAALTGSGKVGYLFSLLIIFALPFSAFLIMPIAVCLDARGSGTALMLTGVGLMWGLVLAALAGIFPGNDWMRIHRLEASLSIFSSFGFLAVLVSGAFAVGARMPLWRFKISSR